MSYLIILFIITYYFFCKSCKIVNQGEGWIIERLGKYHRTAAAGLQIILPFLDKIRAKIDLREQILELPPVPVKTRDGIDVKIEAIIFFQITNPQAFYYNNPLDNYEDIMSFFKVTFINKFSNTIDYIIHKKNFEEIRSIPSYDYTLIKEIQKEFETDENGYQIDFSKYGYSIKRIELKKFITNN